MYSLLDFRAAYVTAEVYDLLMHVERTGSCLPDHQPQARVVPCHAPYFADFFCRRDVNLRLC